MTALLHQPTHATAELHWLAEQVRIETDQRNFGGSWRSLRAARSDRHDLADREGPTRTMADQGGVTEDSRRNGPHCGDLPTVVGAIWRTNVRTPAQHYRHPDPCMCDCSLTGSLTGWWDCSFSLFYAVCMSHTQMSINNSVFLKDGLSKLKCGQDLLV